MLTNAATFFIGALFFTLAAFIQLALSGRTPPRRGSNRADRADWWGVGGAVRRHPVLQHEHERGARRPSVNTDTLVGSGWRTRRPRVRSASSSPVPSRWSATTDARGCGTRSARSWRCTWLNMVGSVFFGLSAIGAYVLPATADFVSLLWANLGTFLGALCFLVAALLSRPRHPADAAAGARERPRRSRAPRAAPACGSRG